MEHVQPYLDILLQNPQYIGIISFILILIGGEPVVLALSFIATTYGLLPLWLIIIIGFTTALIAEIFWFAIARSPWAKIIDVKYAESKILKDFHQYFGKLEGSRSLRLLLLTRFVSGLTILVIIYLSRKNLPFGKFVKYCLVTNLVWTPLVTSAGYLSGKGFTLIYSIVKNLHLALGIVFLVFLAIYLTHRAFGKKIIQNLD